MNNGHGGNIVALAERAGLPPEAIIDFSASINPLGPPDNLRSIVNRSLGSVVHYPEPKSDVLAEVIAARHHISPDRFHRIGQYNLCASTVDGERQRISVQDFQVCQLRSRLMGCRRFYFSIHLPGRSRRL